MIRDTTGFDNAGFSLELMSSNSFTVCLARSVDFFFNGDLNGDSGGFRFR